MSRKSVKQKISDAVAEAMAGVVTDAHMYRNLAERLATGRWYTVEWPEEGEGSLAFALKSALDSVVTAQDDYVLVNPAAFASLRLTDGFLDGDARADVLSRGVYGWLAGGAADGVEVRVYSKLPHYRVVVGESPRPEPDRRLGRQRHAAKGAPPPVSVPPPRDTPVKPPVSPKSTVSAFAETPSVEKGVR
jgi:hypothetical protein